MSTISFPASSSTQEYPSFENVSSNGFTMNPMSSHPPRTPRTSIAYSSVYASTVDITDTTKLPEEIEVDEEEDRYHEAEKRIRTDEVWRDMVETSNGRDKAFKLIQYSIRVFLAGHSRLKGNANQSKLQLDIINRLTSTASGLSLTRKCLLLFNWLEPLSVILSSQQQSNVPYKTSRKRSFLHALLLSPPPLLLTLLNATSDDIATLSKLGLIGKRMGDRAGKFSDWCWFFSTLVALVENGVERTIISNELTDVTSRQYDSLSNASTSRSNPKSSKLDQTELGRLQKKDWWLMVGKFKLLLDLVFVSYDVFKLRRAKASVQAVAGLGSAVLSSAKIYDKHKAILAKSLLASS